MFELSELNLMDDILHKMKNMDCLWGRVFAQFN